jgi:SAM-dependent methyltransferase
VHYLVVPVENPLLFESCILNNPRLAAAGKSLRIFPLFQRDHPGETAAERCSSFLRALPDDLDGWLIFSSDDLEFLENPLPRLAGADPSALHGPLGRAGIKNLLGKSFRAYLGKLRVLENREEGVDKMRVHRLLGAECRAGTPVDALAGPCLILHSSLARRGLPPLSPPGSALNFENFCLEAGHTSRILPLECLLHTLPEFAPITGEIILPEERARMAAEDVYKRPPLYLYDYNAPAVLAAGYMRRRSLILDVGCSYGDNGLFFRDTLEATLWGLEYDQASLDYARRQNIYREIFQEDIESLRLADFSRFFRLFTHIFMGDVLEHLRSPWSALSRFRELLAPGGSFLVSLPNVAHSYVTASLLAGDFEYLSSGILDKTHLRFFTARGQARLFAQTGLEIKNSSACFLIPGIFREFGLPCSLPWAVYEYLLENRHFFVQQYICELIPSSLPEPELLRRNLERIALAPENNPEGWACVEPALNELKLRLTLSMGGKAPDLATRISALAQQGDMRSALENSRMFDPAWYLEQYPEARRSGLSPLEHYCTLGWKEGKNPSRRFNTLHYLERVPEARRSGQCPLFHYLKHAPETDEFRLPPNAGYKAAKEAEYARSLFRNSEGEKIFVEYSPSPPARTDEGKKVRLLAFYQPAFLPSPGRDGRRGPVREWEYTACALPQYTGHYQPHLPIDPGFYDLSLPGASLRQAELARDYGLYGFCYHYYWSDGTKTLNRPIYGLLKRSKPDMPFCIAWNNAPLPWTEGGENAEKSRKQDRHIDIAGLFTDIYPLLRDPRYIRVEGRPLLIIRRPEFHPREHFVRAMRDLRNLCEQKELPGPRLVFMRTSASPSFTPADFGGDSFVEFPPYNTPENLKRLPQNKEIINPRFRGRVLDMRALVEHCKELPPPDCQTYPCVMPAWDNTPLLAEENCLVYEGASPELYADWLRWCVKRALELNPPGHEFVFINAWNDWTRGAHLEPDRKYGYAFLEATRGALLIPERPEAASTPFTA